MHEHKRILAVLGAVRRTVEHVQAFVGVSGCWWVLVCGCVYVYVYVCECECVCVCVCMYVCVRAWVSECEWAGEQHQL